MSNDRNEYVGEETKTLEENVMNPLQENNPSVAYLKSAENARIRTLLEPNSLLTSYSQETESEILHVGCKTQIAAHLMFLVGCVMFISGIYISLTKTSESPGDAVGFIIIACILLVPGSYGLAIIYFPSFFSYSNLPSFD